MKSLLHHLSRVPGIELCGKSLARREHCALVGTSTALLAAVVEWLRRFGTFVPYEHRARAPAGRRVLVRRLLP